MKSKIAFMVCTILCFFSVPVFALDVTTDVLLGGEWDKRIDDARKNAGGEN